MPSTPKINRDAAFHQPQPIPVKRTKKTAKKLPTGGRSPWKRS
jgi:hypothetical protein